MTLYFLSTNSFADNLFKANPPNKKIGLKIKKNNRPRESMPRIKFKNSLKVLRCFKDAIKMMTSKISMIAIKIILDFFLIAYTSVFRYDFSSLGIRTANNKLAAMRKSN